MAHHKEHMKQAAEHAATQMTAELRERALKSGWHPDVVAGLHVKYDGDAYVTQVDPEVSGRAFVHEFGDENTRPTAVLRKYGNTPGVGAKSYMEHLSNSLKGIL
jgi:hypothetical protein